MGSVIELSKYRLSQAKEDLLAAKMVFDGGAFKTSMNRSYYAIFHAIRAVTALEGFDSSKHSGVISYFNRNFVKKGVFDRSHSKIISEASKFREKADYEDFFIASRTDAEKQLANAKFMVTEVEKYLLTKYE